MRAWMVGAMVFLGSMGAVQAMSEVDALKAHADAMQVWEVQAKSGGAVAPAGFEPDTGFAPSGVKRPFPPPQSGWSAEEDALRIAPWVGSITIPGPPTITMPMHAGYYLMGRQKKATGEQWRGWVTRITLSGQIDTSFGSNGWMFTAEPMNTVIDAAMGDGRVYFLGDRTFVTPATQVMCLNLSTGQSCFSAYSGIQLWNASASGPNTGAYAQRLLYDSRYGLFVAAVVNNNNNGQLAGMARIRASDGTLVESFGNGGYYTGMSPTAHWTQNEVLLNDLAIPRAGTPGGIRVYVGGQGKRANGNQHAFTFALDPDSGTLATNWGWYWYWWEGAFNGQTAAINALHVLSDGRLAFAGWVNSAESSYRASFVGVVMPDSQNDPTFCPGGSVSMCLLDVLVSGGSGANAWEYRPYSVPVALAQARNGDLILADRFRDNGFGPQPPIPNTHQRVRQLPFANIRQVKATREVNLGAASGMTAWSEPADLWVGGTGAWSNAVGSGVGEEVIAMVGTSRWNNTDYDATVLHMHLRNDALLSDGFEDP